MRQKSRKKNVHLSPDREERHGPFLAVIGLIILIGFIGLFFGSEQPLGSLTTYLGERTAALPNTPVIIRQQVQRLGNALFDLHVTIPEKSQEIKAGEDILISVELVNFGNPGKTDVALSYIITNVQGEIVLIEHENQAIETQGSFLKSIHLPNLPLGKYTVFVEILYSDKSAIASSEFKITY